MIVEFMYKSMAEYINIVNAFRTAPVTTKVSGSVNPKRRIEQARIIWSQREIKKNLDKYLVVPPVKSDKFSDKILLVDGGDGSVENASIELLENYIYEISFGQNTLNRDKVKSIQNSLNSAENVRDLGLYMKTNGLTKVLSITDLFHYNRLKLLVENYDITTDIAPTECLAIEYMPGDLPYLVERSYSPEMLKMVLKEKIAILELAIDKKGILPIAIKTFLNELNVSREK